MIDIKLQYINKFRVNTQLTPMLNRILLLGSLTLISACSTIVTISPERGLEARSLEEFGLYAEEVFRRQSEANIKIIMYLIDYESDSETIDYERLMAAEETIVDACKNLNNLAVRKAEQRPTNFLDNYLYAHSVDRCDNATRKLEGLLQTL